MDTEQNTEQDDSTQKTEQLLRSACKNRCIIDTGLVDEIVRDGKYHFEAEPITNTLRSVSGLHLFLPEYIEYKLRTYNPVNLAINAKAIREEKYLSQLETFAKAGDMASYRKLRAQYLAA